RIKLLVDLQGPELRVGALSEPIALEEGRAVSLASLALPPELAKQVNAGQELLLDDGKIALVAESAAVARVVRGGVLQSRKSVAAPGINVQLPALTGDDLANIAEAKRFGVTGVMQPFVRSRADLECVRAALDSAGARDVAVLAKVENRQGVEHLEELLPVADEVVIARGDLGNAVPLWDLPAVQKRVASKCRKAGVPFMVVTQMLASMERNPVPTRAEVSDVFNAVIDGAASVMVTGETAVGKYPVEVVRYLANTVAAAEGFATGEEFAAAEEFATAKELATAKEFATGA
ncbi:MAG: hypothetical protein IJ131_09940, partial [Eggerthellaceae bacterium]|nr:hypothetical protein [Eggerthellaceae bacterium]